MRGYMILAKGLGIFNIIWAIITLFFLFLGSQFSFFCGLLLGILYIKTGSGILRGELKARQRYIKWIIPLSILGILNILLFINPKVGPGFRMSVGDVIQFTWIYILFPIVVNFIILFIPKVKEQFK